MPLCTTLCDPADAEPQPGFISVLSPKGGDCGAVIATLLFQPEASGDCTT